MGMIVMAAVTLELSGLVALSLLRKWKDVRYEPVQLFSFAESHRKMLARFISGKARYTVYSRELGWGIKPNGKYNYYRANSKGLRGNNEYSLDRPTNLTRIACFGDSFTHCDEVRNHETWPELMQRADSSLEVMNFGVGGYGLDQAYLRYQLEGVAYDPQIVLIGFMSENINRVVNRFRPFYVPKTGMPLAKPRYRLDGDGLALVENPLPTIEAYRELLENPQVVLPRLGEQDFWFSRTYREGPADFLATVRLLKMLRGAAGGGLPTSVGRVYNAESEAYRITVRLFDQFVAAVAGSGADPVIVVFPHRRDMQRVWEGKSCGYQVLIDWLIGKHYRVIDLMHALEPLREKYTVHDLNHGHFSPLGNQIVAEYVRTRLVDYGLISVPVDEPTGAP
jgi:hypothetical protein